MEPPPPYSARDQYSRTDGSVSNVILTPTTSRASSSVGPSISERDTSSEAGAPLDTPPYTSDGDTIASDLASAAAAAYFESRPATRRVSGPDLTHVLAIYSETTPDDLPCPPAWHERDVLAQDWATFINYLIPHHMDASNDSTAHRKLKAELIDERMEKLTLNDNELPRDASHLDAQLNQLHPVNPPSEKSLERVYRVVQGWNAGFFMPRGLQVAVSGSHPQSAEELTGAIPGAWADHPEEEHFDRHACGRERGRLGGRGRGSGRGRFIRADHTGFHIGGLLSADNDGFRLGGRRGIVADNNGFRIGNLLAADATGFRIGRVQFGGAAAAQPFAQRSAEIPQERGRELLGGQRYDEKRDHSVESSKSSSSDSSVESIESIGSLPAYDELDAPQLPTIRQSLIAWLEHPDQPVTKIGVKQLRSELKSQSASAPAWSNMKAAEVVALRQEVKSLLKAFKELKRAQKQQLRAEMRERRAVRRRERKERRAIRRGEKRARKTLAKGKGRAIPSPPAPPAPPAAPAVFTSVTRAATMPQSDSMRRTSTSPYLAPMEYGVIQPGVPGVPPMTGAPGSHNLPGISYRP